MSAESEHLFNQYIRIQKRLHTIGEDIRNCGTVCQNDIWQLVAEGRIKASEMPAIKEHFNSQVDNVIADLESTLTGLRILQSNTLNHLRKKDEVPTQQT